MREGWVGAWGWGLCFLDIGFLFKTFQRPYCNRLLPIMQRSHTVVCLSRPLWLGWLFCLCYSRFVQHKLATKLLLMPWFHFEKCWPAQSVFPKSKKCIPQNIPGWSIYCLIVQSLFSQNHWGDFKTSWRGYLVILLTQYSILDIKWGNEIITKWNARNISPYL